MLAVITKRDPNFKKDSIDYPLRARFDAEMAQHALGGLGKVQEVTGKTEQKTDAKEDPVAKAQVEQQLRQKDAWKIK